VASLSIVDGHVVFACNAVPPSVSIGRSDAGIT
jgi:hypothetical protein